MESQSVLINTGNILSFNELKLKVGQNTNEELVEALKITLRDSQGKNHATNTINGNEPASLEDRKELKITVKIFMPSADPDLLKNAIDQIFKVFDTDRIETLILAYGDAKNTESELEQLQKLWPIVEKYVNAGEICHVGFSNVDTDVFIKLYEWATVRPSIVQINLATCCVVPPALQAFTKEHDVQLLTHNDPYQLLGKDSLADIFGPTAKLQWVIKYQVHVKCRGVLTVKGYLVQYEK
ncbi:glutamate--cysteine ligase regulatory subunit [Diachasma alloeum]|uniref:glutamate--cysteine ligase regulatory subunit n=1 Tax=Diachasma alloeum TaxID=454923 RepID=UPI0007384169|nr:glutamate--cysteine ligase regulatory subunit [Diachasma alloeum]